MVRFVLLLIRSRPPPPHKGLFFCFNFLFIIQNRWTEGTARQEEVWGRGSEDFSDVSDQYVC